MCETSGDRASQGRPRARCGGGTTVWRLAAAECWLRLQTGASALDELLASDDAPAPSLEAVSLAGRTFSHLAPPHRLV